MIFKNQKKKLCIKYALNKKIFKKKKKIFF